ncbi:hypothetical protein Acj9p069 [Acinetobacter phage Acj9]|uniref:Uncharacterized protein n=1 Tax=Acinetobacter phage Acj9 TaxID=760939 RepID=E5EPK3_9CAUD|nr:hypothetical protein Acj9p069 [Acinetobacter phage Acj9]ADG59969.1 hypothetical protein Acj9p069 [Acinetobacter phage Acj9]
MSKLKMEMSSTEKLICFHLASLNPHVSHKVVQRTYLDWVQHLFIEREGNGLKDLILVKVDYNNPDSMIEIVRQLHTGLNSRLLNLEYTGARWVSIGNCRFSAFRLIANDVHAVLTNAKDEFQIVLSKKTGEVLSSRNSAEINYVELLLNPETKIVEDL